MKETTPILTETKKKEVKNWINYIYENTGIKFRCKKIKDYIFIKTLYLLLVEYNEAGNDFISTITNNYINNKYKKKVYDAEYFGYDLTEILRQYIIKYYYGDLTNFSVVWEYYNDLTRDEFDKEMNNRYRILDKKMKTNTKKIINLMDNIAVKMIENNTFAAFEEESKDTDDIYLEWVSVDDERTCDICLDLSGRRFYSLLDAPSRHPNCRCYYLIYKNGEVFTIL